MLACDAVPEFKGISLANVFPDHCTNHMKAILDGPAPTPPAVVEQERPHHRARSPTVLQSLTVAKREIPEPSSSSTMVPTQPVKKRRVKEEITDKPAEAPSSHGPVELASSNDDEPEGEDGEVHDEAIMGAAVVPQEHASASDAEDGASPASIRGQRSAAFGDGYDDTLFEAPPPPAVETRPVL